MSYNPEILEIDSVKDAAIEMTKIGATGIDIMAPKAVFFVIKLHGVRNAMANIIKQEALSIGAEAAVNAGTVNCSVERTDVILMGTLKQYRMLIEKLKNNVSELPEIAKELEDAIGQIE
ncbi:MAG: hypothetical protein GXO64_03250 [Candidatus Micrarchaeota archaeon]|nr:hypothetical protein [Candidatus Micrarchaeota archaeon]